MASACGGWRATSHNGVLQRWAYVSYFTFARPARGCLLRPPERLDRCVGSGIPTRLCPRSPADPLRPLSPTKGRKKELNAKTNLVLKAAAQSPRGANRRFTHRTPAKRRPDFGVSKGGTELIIHVARQRQIRIQMHRLFDAGLFALSFWRLTFRARTTRHWRSWRPAAHRRFQVRLAPVDHRPDQPVFARGAWILQSSLISSRRRTAWQLFSGRS